MPPPEASSETAWILFALLAAAAAGVAGIYLMLAALRRIERRQPALERLAGLENALQRLGERDAGLDLRRVEHVLVDVREALKRLEDRLLAVAEARAADGAIQALSSPGAGASAVVDRVLQRLLALGYDRIQIVTASDEIAPLAEREGSLVVEARRDGVFCKGRVHVARGYVGEIEIQPAYSAFP